MKAKILSLILISGLGLTSQLNATPTQNIKAATAACEQEVPQHCMNVTCPQYCDTMRTQAGKESCKAECTLENRCKLKPLANMDDPKNMALDADNREKLFACIAQKRDPEGKISGRRMEDWKTITTPSMEKAMGKR